MPKSIFKYLKMNTLEAGIPQCIDLLSSAKNIIITTHQSPDGDAIGSALGLYHFAKQIGINAIIINTSPTPSNLTFLPSADTIHVFSHEIDDEAIQKADAIFILDLNSIKRIQTMEESVQRSSAKKVLIDHHQNPVIIPDIAVIDTGSCSTCELIYKIILASGESFSREIATALYTGIMTDTGSFRFSRTTADVFRIAGYLVENGADPVDIAENVFNSSGFNRTVLLGKALGSLQLFYDGKLSVMCVTAEDFLKTSALEEDTEGFVQHTLTIAGVVMGILFIEVPETNYIKVSIRSKGNITANTLAAEFNGGGHLNAAAARMPNLSLSEVRTKIIETAGQYLK
ncbi:MAG: bifunctional oligoribonuclease/PAP phosphatase NrnA [Bacteroidetes bacterium]|nr:bifunctional oligoribonuclease/PAP phosphatase NrnA [Bacteroidota bacterium]